jgi:hypothetical protein
MKGEGEGGPVAVHPVNPLHRVPREDIENRARMMSIRKASGSLSPYSRVMHSKLAGGAVKLWAVPEDSNHVFV